MRAILIYGSRKSGTTLLQRLVDGGGYFCHPSETKIKGFAGLKKKIDAAKNADRGEILSESELEWYFQVGYFDELGIDENKYWSSVKSELPSIESLADYVNLHVHTCLGSIVDSSKLPASNDGFVIKEVGGSSRSVIDTFQTSFPEGKVLAIVRKPWRTSSAVFRNRRNVKNIKLNLKKTIREAVFPWRNIRDILNTAESANFKIVSYEELTENTAKVVAEISGFIGLPLMPNATPTINGKPMVVRTASKNTNEVFSREQPWYVDLTLIEIIVCVMAAIRYAPTAFKLRSKFPEMFK